MNAAAFLPHPSEIRAALQDAIQGATALDMAVAFVGSDWADLLGEFRGPIRLVCWLSSTNTNPYAVADLRRRSNVRVRQMDLMHAKVYIASGRPGTVAIVGSANLSSSALSADEAGGQYEAAVRLQGAADTHDVSAWFERLWGEAQLVRSGALAKAQRAWDKAKRRGLSASGVASEKRQARLRETMLPRGWQPSAEIRALAARVGRRAMPWRGDAWAALRGLDPADLSPTDVEDVIRCLSGWAKHPASFAPLASVPIREARRSFVLAFNEGLPIEERFRGLLGDYKLPGLGLPAWTMILHWCRPKGYPPYNQRTTKFLKAFELDLRGLRSLTPRSYARWRAFAQDLAQRLGLPTAGHIDRLVWEYTKDLPLH